MYLAHKRNPFNYKKIGKIESNVLIVVILGRENFWSGQLYGVDVIVRDFTAPTQVALSKGLQSKSLVHSVQYIIDDFLLLDICCLFP